MLRRALAFAFRFKVRRPASARRVSAAPALAFIFAALAPRAAGAEVALSKYEASVQSEALAAVKGKVEQAPFGKRIERIEVVRLEVFDHRDPVPNFFNIFHATTRERVVHGELLFREGTVFDQARLDESARNLRSLKQFSLVLIVPLVGSRPDRVRVLVVTKDVWSLRLNTNFDYDGTLNRLVLNPSEWNLLGTHVSFGALFVLSPTTYSVGAVVEHPRLAGSRISTLLFGNVVFNRHTLDAEGSFGAFSYGKPLYSRTTKVGWAASVAWRDDIQRDLVASEVELYDAPSTAADDQIPAQYTREVFGGEYEVVRSFGLQSKFDLSFGVEALRRRYLPFQISGPEREPPRAAVDDFVRDILPVSDTRVSPFIELEAKTSEFRSVLNYETLGLQEDLRLGHHALVRLYPASTAFASTRDLFGVVSALGYTLPLADGMVRAMAVSSMEVAARGRHEGAVTLALHAVSPDVGFGRFVYSGIVLNRYQNALNRRSALGGDTRLRGFPAGGFKGKDAVVSNVEFRSSAIDILSAQVGGAAFYDQGDAFDGFAHAELKQSVGVGVRVLLAQANRSVFRADYGVPITRAGFVFPGAIFATFGQAFGMLSIAAPSVLDLVP